MKFLQLLQPTRFRPKRSGPPDPSVFLVRSDPFRLIVWLCWLTGLVGVVCPSGLAAFHGDLLNGTDFAVLRPPAAMFEAEVRRLPQPMVNWTYLPATNSPAVQSMNAELSDLRKALRLQGVRDPEAIVRAHEEQRSDAVAKFDDVRQINPGLDTPDSENERVSRKIRIVEGLPTEFADYFRGWLAFKEGRTNDAIKSFEAVLALPEKDRRFKSVWAAYLLGRAQQDAQPGQAVSSFQLVRALAKQGFSDGIGLAAESIGWEARAHLKAKRYVRAMELYREQFAAGDHNGVVSLKWVAGEVFAEGGRALADAAAHPIARRIVTAWFTDQPVWSEPEESGGEPPIATWLNLIEQVGTNDTALAEQLSLAAYHAGDWVAAKRWVDRSAKAPVGEWIRAKLLLRNGKRDEAAKLLSGLAPLFPRDERCDDAPASTRMADSLTTTWATPGKRIQAELAVLRLGQGRYADALDLFLKADSAVDAGYVAERVLGLDELKSFVDRAWPDRVLTEEERQPLGDTADCRDRVRHEALVKEDGVRSMIRSLLARRLVRASRGAEARPYVAPDLLGDYDAMMAGLRTGEDESLLKEQRARGWWSAAQIMRTNGIVLVATEVEPDWAAVGGNDEPTPTLSNRFASATLKLFAASEDEVRRARSSATDPEIRFHYRYQAAFIAMDAAKLLPDNEELTATILYTAGCWLKNREPKVADLFYKALVRRCGKTELGRAADVKRWFPPLDEDGHPILTRRRFNDNPLPLLPGIDTPIEVPAVDPVISP